MFSPTVTGEHLRVSDSSDLPFWRALYDAVLTPATPGVFEVLLPFYEAPLELLLDDGQGASVQGILEAVRVEDGRLRLYTSAGTIEAPLQPPRLRTPEGGLVDRSTILAAAERVALDDEVQHALQLAGHHYSEGRTDEAIALLAPWVESGSPAALAALGVIERLEGVPGAAGHLARASEGGSSLAETASAAAGRDELVMLLLALAKEGRA